MAGKKDMGKGGGAKGGKPAPKGGSSTSKGGSGAKKPPAKGKSKDEEE
jgi:hypothetical protein